MKARKPAPWMEGLTSPCDADLFMGALDAFQRGAEVPLPLPDKPEPGCLYLADIPMNRGGMAATKYLREAGVKAGQAYLWRIMHMGEVIDATKTAPLSQYVRPSAADPECMEFNEVLLRAVAEARVHQLDTSTKAVFDLDDVAARAATYYAAELAKQGAA